MADRRTRRLFGGVLVLVGAVLLIAALFSPWYTYEATVSTPLESGSSTINSFPGLPAQNGTVQCSASGSVRCPYSQTSYQGAHENNTAAIAEAGYLLLIIGFVLGFVGGILGMASRADSKRARPALTLAIIALLVALLTPLLFFGAVPGALSKDIPSAERTTQSGPWSSFYGSSTSSPFAGLTVKLTWGPALGWYVSFVAFVILLVGVAFLFRNRRDPPEPSPVAVSVPVPTPAPQSAQAVPE